MSRGGAGVVRLLALAPVLLVALSLGDLLGIVRSRSMQPACPSDAALVMGAAQYDGRPSPAFERRLERALALYRDGCVAHVVVSGGGRRGDATTEGRVGVDWLAAQDVPVEALSAEERATTSAENVRNALPALRGGTVVIVSDDLHVWRASWLARREGLDVSVASVRGGGDRLAYLLREWRAMLAYRLGVVR
jgi:uncharacterized SAM-binding protein YcdF (DUF218 family)